jgi:hypothetical protein
MVIPHAKNSTLMYVLGGTGIYVEIREHTANQVIHRVSASTFSHAQLDNQKEFVLRLHLVPHKFYYCQ